MKIFKRLFAIAIALSLVIFLSGFTKGENNAAGITKDGECGLLDGYGRFIISNESISVENHGGFSMLICHAKGVPTDGKVHQSAGFTCGVGGNATNLSWNIVSANGNATLRCMIKKSKD